MRCAVRDVTRRTQEMAFSEKRGEGCRSVHDQLLAFLIPSTTILFLSCFHYYYSLISPCSYLRPSLSHQISVHLTCSKICTCAAFSTPAAAGLINPRRRKGEDRISKTEKLQLNDKGNRSIEHKVTLKSI